MVEFPQCLLTPRQEEILNTISSLIERLGHSPTYQELADELGITPNAAVQSVNRLILHGRLRRQPHVPRSLQVIPDRKPRQQPNKEASA